VEGFKDAGEQVGVVQREIFGQVVDFGQVFKDKV